MIHFKYFPRIDYCNNSAINIMVRTKVRDLVLKNSVLWYKYTIRDGDRADILATKYYGNCTYTWVIYYANDIFNPIFDWPLTQEQFLRYIEKKYGSVRKAKSELETPHHYLLDGQYIIDENTYKEPRSQYNYEYNKALQKFNTTTLSALSDKDKERFEAYFKQVWAASTNKVPVSYFEWEYQLNENKRNIKILDKAYIAPISNELKNIFTE